MLKTEDNSKEFDLTDNSYRYICDFIHKHTGIHLGDNKRELVYTRLARRIREHRLESFQAYCDLLKNPCCGIEIEYMINALTTNLTSFFREEHHFDHFSKEILPYLVSRKNNKKNRVRIWSAACSTGEEPYSIAISILNSSLILDKLDIRILATDLNTDVLKQASIGCYDSSNILSSNYRYFDFTEDNKAHAKPIVKNLIRFRKLNLLAKWPMNELFDVIFCRNVLIYFDVGTKDRLVDRFVGSLHVGGWLYLGHSESASGSHPKLDLIGQTTYRRI